MRTSFGSDSSVNSDILDTYSTHSSTSPSERSETSPATAETILSLAHGDGQERSRALSGFSFHNLPADIDPYDHPVLEARFDAAVQVEVIEARPRLVGEEHKMAITSGDSAAKKRVEYFEDEFAYKEDHVSHVKERVRRESPVVVELRSNVIIKDEYAVITGLSSYLAQRYRRSEAHIHLTVEHSLCMLMGGTFDPTYVLAISTIPVDVQPVTNKRNAYLLQQYVAELLQVPPERGVVRFMAIPEERLATRGTTVFGEIERQEKIHTEETTPSIRRALTGRSRKKSKAEKKEQEAKGREVASQKRKSFLGGKKPSIKDLNRKSSAKSILSLKSNKSAKTSEPTDPAVPAIPASIERADGRMTPSPAPPNHDGSKSPMSSNGKAAAVEQSSISKNETPRIPPPPPIPQSSPPKLGKRKSLAAIFKR